MIQQGKHWCTYKGRLGPLSMYELDLIAQQFYETCNIRLLWTELVRKYNIVSSKRQITCF